MCLGASNSMSLRKTFRPMGVACPISTVIKQDLGMETMVVWGGMDARACTPRISLDPSSYSSVAVSILSSSSCVCW